MSHLYFQKCKQTADTQIINVNKQLTSLRVYINKQLTFLQLSKQTRLLGHFQPLCQYGDKLFGLGRLFLWCCEAYKNSEPIWLRWIWSYRSIGFPSVKSEYLCKKWEANWWDNILCSCLYALSHTIIILHTAVKYNFLSKNQIMIT